MIGGDGNGVGDVMPHRSQERSHGCKGGGAEKSKVNSD